jgi:hypothetical protein
VVIMADLIEVTKDCTGCGLPTTYRTSKPVANVQCKHCGRGVYLGKQLIADARAALLPQHRSGGQTATAPLPDQSAAWTRERPFTTLGPQPRPRGTCATCGTPAGQGSPRGTFVWCPQCGQLRYDAATAGRGVLAADLAGKRARAAVAAAERARIDQAPTPDLADVLDLAGKTGVVHAAIAGAINAMRNPPTDALWMRAAQTTARLQALDHAVSKAARETNSEAARETNSEAARETNPYAALSALKPALVAELHDAEQIAREIEQANAEDETSAALEARRLELTAEREARALLPARRAIAARPPRVTPAVATWQICQLPHPRRLIRPPATHTIWLTNSEYSNIGKRFAICANHDPVKVQQAYAYSHYTMSPITTGR